MAEREEAQVPHDEFLRTIEPPPLDQNKLNNCILEGVSGRPLDCPNNPAKNPKNYRPKVCEGCACDPELWKVALVPLNEVYIRIKQTQSRGAHPWQRAQAEKMPALIISPGEIDKKAQDYYKEWSNLIKHQKI